MNGGPSSVRDLFVFAGAGVSMSAPTSLPSFNSMRDAVLTQLGFADYVRTDWQAPLSDKQKIIHEMAPEPFFGRLVDSGIDLSDWLRDVLEPDGARPNAAHRVLAELCTAGAHVWTVNFDPFIEKAAHDLGHGVDPLPWPRHPECENVIGQLLKPHGTLGGRFIITPADVLRPLSADWFARLEADLSRSTHVVFVGYSGRDVDFQNRWRTVITGGQQVLWFDRPDANREHMRRVLKSIPSVHFPDSRAHVRSDGTIEHNPSWDFVQWCRDNRLIARTDKAQQDSLLGKRGPDPRLPRLPQSGPVVQAQFAETLGEVDRARRLLLRAARRPSTTLSATTLLARSWLNTPSPTARAATSVWRLIPPVAPLAEPRNRLRHYHLVQLFNAARHGSVVRLTDEMQQQGELSDALLGLRWGAQKMLGDVAGVITEAGKTARESRSTNNAVRCVAAFHWCHSLVWAGRFDELRSALEGYFRPIATITDSRWMAWADYIQSCLELADPDSRNVDRALTVLDTAITRFRAEGHRSGLVAVRTVRLTALRLHDSLGDYLAEAHSLQETDRDHPMELFGRQALILELAQGLAYRYHDTARARRAIEPLCHSQFPVHRTLARALAGQWEPDAALSTEYLRSARRRAGDIGLTGIAAFCEQLLGQPHQLRPGTELVFP